MAGEAESRGRDLGLLILRIGVGVVFLGHGLQKFGLFDSGSYPASISAQADFLTLFGYSSQTLLSWVLTITELAAGLSLLLGVVTPLGGAAAIGIGLQFVAGPGWQAGLFGNEGAGGFEFALMMVAAGCALALTGPGTYALEKPLGLDRFTGRSWGLAGIALGAVAGLGVLTVFGQGLGG